MSGRRKPAEAWAITTEQEKKSFTLALRDKYLADDADAPKSGLVIQFDIRGKPRDQTKGKAELGFLRNVVLCNSGITHAGIPETHGLKFLCPNVVDLDLSGNLMTSWRDLVALFSQLKQLKYANVSDNPLHSHQEVLEDSTLDLPAIENLVLNRTGVSWYAVSLVCQRLPTIHELHICGNGYRHISEEAVKYLNNVQCLRLNNNAFESWDEIAKLGSLPKLKMLIISGNPLKNVFYKQAKILTAPTPKDATSEDPLPATDMDAKPEHEQEEEFVDANTTHSAVDSAFPESIVSTASAVCQNIINEVFENVCQRASDTVDNPQDNPAPDTDTAKSSQDEDGLTCSSHPKTENQIETLKDEVVSNVTVLSSSPQDTQTTMPSAAQNHKPLTESQFHIGFDKANAKQNITLQVNCHGALNDETATADDADGQSISENDVDNTGKNSEENDKSEHCAQISQQQIQESQESSVDNNVISDESCDTVKCLSREEFPNFAEPNAQAQESPLPHRDCQDTGNHIEKIELHNNSPDNEKFTTEEELICVQSNIEDNVPFETLETLCVSDTEIASFDSLQAMSLFPKLTSLRIKNEVIFPSLSQEERRQMLIACLPHISILNGSEISSSERLRSELDFLQKYKSDPEPPGRFTELVKKHGAPVQVAHIDLGAGFCEWADITVVFENAPIHNFTCHVVQPVGKLRKYLAERVLYMPIKSFRMYHYACGPYHDPADDVTFDELLLNSLPISRHNVMHGDEIHIEITTDQTFTMRNIGNDSNNDKKLSSIKKDGKK